MAVLEVEDMTRSLQELVRSPASPVSVKMMPQDSAGSSPSNAYHCAGGSGALPLTQGRPVRQPSKLTLEHIRKLEARLPRGCSQLPQAQARW